MKTAKQRATRASGHRGAEAPRREHTRANLRLDAECYRRLLVASVMENRPAGEIVSQLIAEHLKRWSMPGDLSARGKCDVKSDRLDGAAVISPDVSQLAA